MKPKRKNRPPKHASPPLAPPEAALPPGNPLVDVLTRPAGPAGQERPWLPDGEREFVRSLDALFRTFRMKACEVWSRKRFNAACARTVTRLQSSFPGFTPGNLTPETAAGIFDMIEALLIKVPWWRRRVLQREAAHLLAELYNNSYDALRDHALLERVEQLYLGMKE